MKVRMYALIPRKAGMTRNEFHDYYRHPHGTMGRTMTTMRGYVQNHQIQTGKLGEDQARYDAVAEIWLNNEHDALHFRQEPNLIKYLVEDEPKFIDMDRLSFFAGTTETLISSPEQNAQLHPGDTLWSPLNCPLSVKLLLFMEAEGQPSWRGDNDVELGRRLGAFRQARVLPLRSMHGDTPPYRGLLELWWPTQSIFEQSVNADPEALEALTRQAGRHWATLTQAERFI